MNENEKDKRLIIPKDAFEEEASEGLGKLNRVEAAADLRELKGRIIRRVRKPRMIWLPAAAAVVILLVASTVYIALFRDRSKPEAEIALAETAITDTALIAMAQPITIEETKSTALVTAHNMDVVPAGPRDELMEADAGYGKAAEDKDEIAVIQEAVEEEAVAEEEKAAEEYKVAEEVVVEAMPMMEKAAVSEKKEKAADVAMSEKNERAADVVMSEKNERAAATKTIEDSAVAMPGTGAGMPDRQAGPIGGMEEFNSWIQRNTKYPEEVVPRVKQVVIVTFKVAADSTIYDLKAERTPGELFTREAFRLLREGPGWEPAVRAGKLVPEEVKISIVFK